MNKKLYGFKLKYADIVNLFNDTDLIGYEKDDNGNWYCNGGMWLVNNPTYIIDSFYDFFLSDNWEQITKKDFSDIVASDDDLNGYTMIDKSYPIEKMFGKTMEVKNVYGFTDIKDYSDNATFTFLGDKDNYEEPMYYTKDELLNGDEYNCKGLCRIIY